MAKNIGGGAHISDHVQNWSRKCLNYARALCAKRLGLRPFALT